MKLNEMARRQKARLLDSIIASKQRTSFKAWAAEMRKLIPVAEMSSEKLYRHYVVETAEIWKNLRAVYGTCSLETLKAEAVKCRSTAEQGCKVIEMGKQMER